MDLGAPSMITAWLLRQRKVVVSLSSPGHEAAGLIHVETSLKMVLNTLQQLLSQNHLTHLTCHQLHPPHSCTIVAWKVSASVTRIFSDMEAFMCPLGKSKP